MMHRAPVGLVIILASVIGACARPAAQVSTRPGRDAPRDTIVLASLAFAPYAGTTIPLEARYHRSAGAPADPAANIAWESNGFRSGWVAGAGMLTLLEPGKLVIVARHGRAESRQTIEVLPNPVAMVRFTTRTLDAEPGDTLRLRARTLGRDGMSVPDARVAYAVSSRGLDADRVARVTEDGRFVADEPGIYTVIAECGGAADQLVVRVDYRSAGTATPSVTEAAPRHERVTVLAAVVTRAEPIERVRIESPDYEPYAGTALQLTSKVWTRGAREPQLRAPVQWRSSDTTIALVDENGRVLFRKSGRVTISASASGRESSKRFAVQQHPAARVVLIASTLDVRTHQAVQLREQVWQMGGTQVTDANVNYALIAQSEGGTPRAATISDDRTFVAREPGIYTIIAQVGGFADRVTFLVTSPEPVRRATGRVSRSQAGGAGGS